MVKFEGQLYEIKTPGGATREIRLPEIRTLHKDKETEKWVWDGDYLYMGDYLFNSLYNVKKNIKKYKGDLLFVIDGEEGSGKSTLARQVAIVLDQGFTHERIFYSTREFIIYHKVGKDFTACVLDESREQLDRKSTMSKQNKNFNNFLSESRQEHKMACLVLPSIFDLDKYSAEHRAKFLIHCYKQKGRIPGSYKFYGKNGIKALFRYHSKDRSYNQYPAFVGSFRNQQICDLDEYDKRKRAAIEKYYTKLESSEPQTKDEIIREFILQCIDQFPDWAKDLTKDKQAELFGYTRASIYQWQKDREEQES